MTQRRRGWVLAVLACAAAGSGVRADTPVALARALADPHRPAEQVRLDATRKPAQVIGFAGVRRGDRVADFMPGNAYFTRILSRLVGPAGRVFAFTPQEQVEHCDPAEIAGSRALAGDAAYGNVVWLQAPVNEFAVPVSLDVIWTAQNYHDLHDRFLGPADVERVGRQFFAALRPGGVLLVIDHVAVAGSGLQATETLHRIDPRSVRAELQRAGFRFDGELDVLRNDTDDHVLPVFDPAIRGRTDQFVYRFRKPR